jgi:hypothetical protein
MYELMTKEFVIGFLCGVCLMTIVIYFYILVKTVTEWSEH